MGYFVIRRLLIAIPVLALVSLMSFAVIWLVPGDPAAVFLDAGATPQQLAQVRHQLGLDEPFWQQMLAWCGRILHGDLGRSILLNRSVSVAIIERLPVTLSLTALALAFAVLMGVVAGLLAAVRHGGWADQSIMVLALVGLSVPEFWLGLVLIFVFAVRLHWFPAGDFVPIGESLARWWQSMALPAFTLAAVQMGFIARMTRSAMLEVLHQDFIRTADSKGLPWSVVVTRHGLPNALVPILTVIGIVTGGLLGGAVVIEQVFSLPGVGRLVIGAVLSRDFPVIQGTLLFIAVIYLLINLCVDVLYAVVDPRVRLSSSAAPFDPDATRLRAALRLTAPVLRRLLHNRSFAIGAALMLFIVLVAILAPVLAPYDPLRSNFRARFVAPDAAHWFGTDHFGRDLLSRVIYGGRVSLTIGFFVVLLTGVAGTAIGALAGYFRRLDNPLMRLMDALMAFPAILLAIVISAVLGASVVNVVIALSIATSPHTARIVRGSVLVVREMEYVEAGRALGASDLRLLFGHVLINALAPLIVRLTYVFAIAILAEAVLSYIGVGPPPPTPTFGNIIAGERDFLETAPWAMIFPGLAIVISVLGLNLLGDGLRDVLDPRMKL